MREGTIILHFHPSWRSRKGDFLNKWLNSDCRFAACLANRYELCHEAKPAVFHRSEAMLLDGRGP